MFLSQDGPLPAASTRATSALKGALALTSALLLLLVPDLQLFAQASGAQTSAPIPANSQGSGTSIAQTGPVVLSGAVVDPDNAEIPGATLTLTPPSGKAYVVQSNTDGTYAFRGVPPGTYSLTVTMPGFASFARLALRIGSTPQTLNPKLTIQDQQTVVDVTANQNTVSTDQDNNASSTVLKGKDRDALSDDPDELSSELTALAGPAAGPNGGQIYIDGFTGGQLPPKSSIREIRINQNPFSAQYDRSGYGRVEVFTKPGTDKFHAYAQINGNEKDFNTGSPFTDNATQPGYHTIFSFGQFSGPISKTASFTVGGSYRQIQNNAIVNPPVIYSTSQNAGTICNPGPNTACGIFTTTAGNGFSLAETVPQTRFDINPRVDLALGEKNTLTVRFQYEHNNLQNQGIGGLNLPSTGTNNTSSETTLQASDTQIISDKIINELRFEYQREHTITNPISTAAQVSVQGAFTGGGSGGGPTEDTQNHFELQNYTSIALAKHFIRLGGRLRYTGDTNTTTAGNTGTFTYSSICDYADVTSACTGGVLPTSTSPSDFTITQIPHPTVLARTVDLGIYAEDDWKIKPTWTFSYGLRYETQNFIHDQADFAPRLSTAYGVGKKTVIRAGVGIFYDRFNLNNQLTTTQLNGINQQQYTLTSTNADSSTLPTTCSPANPLGSDVTMPYGCSIAGSRLSIHNIASNLKAPYQVQTNIGFDQQILPNFTASFNYQHVTGLRQFNSDVPNAEAAPVAGAAPNLIYQYQSAGVFNQNQLIANFNMRNFHGATIGGFYAFGFANADSGGINSFASIPNNLHADYGRASFDVRNRVFLYGSYNAPHLITISPFIAYQAGNPYNITTGVDEFNDNVYNYRAAFANSSTPADQLTKSIAGCGNFTSPTETDSNNTSGLVPINYCTGPAAFSFNLRLTKTWGFGPSTRPTAAQSGGAGAANTAGGGGRGPGGGGGRGGPGGPGGPGGGNASSGKKYNVGLGAQAQNLFNDANRSTPVGTLTSPSFGTSTSLAGGPYSNGSALRRFLFQATFSF